MRTSTIGELIGQNKGFGPGFDFLRIFLAFFILYGHAKWVAGSAPPDFLVGSSAAAEHISYPAWEGWRRPKHAAIVPMFFALSGFLVAGSAFRLRSVKQFMFFRVLRIVPALSVEVVLSALLLGPLLTSIALSDYLTSFEFYRYFGNIFGFVTFHLPGVFERNPVPNIVNINLWTLPAEFYCYLITAILMISMIFFNRFIFTLLFSIVSAIVVILSLSVGFGITLTTAPAHVLTYYFFTGCLFYHWKDNIPANMYLFLLIGIVTYFLLMFRSTVYIAPVFLTYVTVYIGAMNIPTPQLLKKNDYSYGMYLYGFPISQALIVVFPGLTGKGGVVVILTVIITTIFAALSWTFIEKPALRLKSKIKKINAGPIQPHTTDKSVII